MSITDAIIVILKLAEVAMEFNVSTCVFCRPKENVLIRRAPTEKQIEGKIQKVKRKYGEKSGYLLRNSKINFRSGR